MFIEQKNIIDSSERDNIAVVIPTFQRQTKLKRCLDSILKSTYKKLRVFVYCDNNDSESFEFVSKSYSDSLVHPILVNAHWYVIGCWNNFTRSSLLAESLLWNWDMMTWAVDDIEVNPDCLEKAVQAMKERYSDYDGVVGLSQICPGHPNYTYKPYGQVLLGKKFIKRYKEVDYQVCAPCFTHFYQDEEMYTFAHSLGKFYHCQEAILKHYHPSFIREERDLTHEIVRGEIFQQDRKTFAERTAKGLVWGKSWML